MDFKRVAAACRTLGFPFALLGAIVYVPSVLAAWRAGLFGLVALDTIVLGAVIALYLGDQWPTRVRAAAFCLIVYVLSVGLLMSAGAISQVYLFGFSILATLLLGLRAGTYASALSAVTLLFLGAAGLAAEGMAHPNIADPVLGWVVNSLNFALVNILLTLAVGLVISALNHALEREVGARQTLERERAFLRTLIDAIPDLIYTKDLRGRYVIGNQATLARFKLEAESQLAGKTVFDMLPAELATAINAQDLEVLAGRPILNHEGLSVDAEGRPAWYQTIKMPLRDTQGEITAIVCVGRDITER
ncbi:MAG: PAS domain-containing protein, partial [Burkholderiaceae bacterium]|nr:PAS domain-containing protein [Burkholderiaceae bacterium]